MGRVRVSDPDDPNAGSYGYALVDGNGSAGNTFFSLDANSALQAVVPDYETNATHAVRIRVTDEWNASLEKSLVIEVVDLARATRPQTSPGFQLGWRSKRRGRRLELVHLAWFGSAPSPDSVDLSR